MIKLQQFANESLNEPGEDFDLIFDQFVTELESDDDKAAATELKESWKKAFAHHAKNAVSGTKSFLHSMWNDSHTGNRH